MPISFLYSFESKVSQDINAWERKIPLVPITAKASLESVLKCKLYYYLTIVRPINEEMETTAIEKRVCYLQFSRGGVMPCRATGGSIRVRQETEGKGKMWARTCIVIFMGRNGRRQSKHDKQI